jgi:imidazolonepropionase-like amidohydrolase
MRVGTLTAFILALSLIGTATRAEPRTDDLAVIHARIYPSPDAPAIENGSILAHGGRIVAVGPGASVRIPPHAKVLDAHGGVVTAGFWNSHVHLIAPDLLEAGHKPAALLDATLAAMLTRWGFTTVFDIASQLDNTETLRRRVASGEVAGPNILTTGDPFFPEGGTPIYIKSFMAAHHFPDWEVATPEKAAARAARQLDQGADGVKIFSGALVGGKVGVLPMRLDIARAAVAEAHRRGRPAFAHPQNYAGIDVAIDSGVDILAHTTPTDGPWPPELIRRLREHHMALIPTLTLFDVEFKKEADIPPEVRAKVLDTVVAELKAYADAGGDILFGTDVGYIEEADTTEEFQLMGRAIGWRAILASLTTAPARRFGYAERRGRVARGMDADLVVLDADPAKDATAFAKVRQTVRRGRVIWARLDSQPPSP